MLRVNLQRDEISFLNEDVYPYYDLEGFPFVGDSVIIHRDLNYADRVIICDLVSKEVIDVYQESDGFIEINLEWI
jgi:hypothetical protein